MNYKYASIFILLLYSCIFFILIISMIGSLAVRELCELLLEPCPVAPEDWDRLYAVDKALTAVMGDGLRLRLALCLLSLVAIICLEERIHQQARIRFRGRPLPLDYPPFDWRGLLNSARELLIHLSMLLIVGSEYVISLLVMWSLKNDMFELCLIWGGIALGLGAADLRRREYPFPLNYFCA